MPIATSATTILEDGTTQSLVKFNAYDTNGNLRTVRNLILELGRPEPFCAEHWSALPLPAVTS